MSLNSENSVTSVSCDEGYILVGCSASSFWRNIDGSWINNNTCYARNGRDRSNDDNGVYAYARCCNNLNIKNCNDITSEKSGNNNGDTVTASCNNNINQVLTGCTMSTFSIHMDGAYAGNKNTTFTTILSNTNNLCNAENGANGNGIYAQARCCETENNCNLECYTIWSKSKSGSSDDALTSVTCPNNYFLSSCSVYTISQNIDGAYFGNNSNTCYAQNGYAGDDVWANAICCRQWYYYPSEPPTFEPTFEPTCLVYVYIHKPLSILFLFLFVYLCILCILCLFVSKDIYSSTIIPNSTNNKVSIDIHSTHQGTNYDKTKKTKKIDSKIIVYLVIGFCCCCCCCCLILLIFKSKNKNKNKNKNKSNTTDKNINNNNNSSNNENASLNDRSNDNKCINNIIVVDENTRDCNEPSSTDNSLNSEQLYVTDDNNNNINGNNGGNHQTETQKLIITSSHTRTKKRMEGETKST